MKWMVKFSVLISACLAIVGCETMNVTGSVGYVDPNTGAKGGMTFRDDGTAGWYVKVPWSSKDNGSGVAVVEGDIPIERNSGK